MPGYLYQKNEIAMKWNLEIENVSKVLCYKSQFYLSGKDGAHL